MASIRASVGAGGVNNEADVKVVQQLLTDNKAFLGLVNGKCGDDTIAAIKAFQRSFTPNPDGRVDPQGNTLRRLNSPTTTKKFKIVHGSNFTTSSEGEHLNPTLLAKVTEFCQYLIDNGIVTGNITFTQGVRNR